MIRAIQRMADGDRCLAIEGETGLGALETERGLLPLVALDVRAKVRGLVADVTVRQTFRNAFSEPLEATYIFPLPDRAAVTSFRMRVGERTIRAELKERGQARAAYREAIRAGHRAAIAEEERSGTFNLRVGNIPAGEEVSVELSLVGPLPVSGGEATFRFPLVVAPRYVPGIPLDGPSVGTGWASDTDEVPDASRVTPPVLLPGFPNPVRLSIELELDPAGLEGAGDGWAEQIRSSLHSVITDEGPPWRIRLEPGERLDRDFVLRFPVAAEAVVSTLLCAAGESEEGVFALTLVPPAADAGRRPEPRDVVILLDRSGSMSGWKMVAARRAAGRIIDTLLDQDRFTVIAFDTELEQPPDVRAGLVEATDRARWRALEWLARIDARGGTEVGAALRRAADALAASGGSRQQVVVLVTDGQVAGEDALLRSWGAAAGRRPVRVHTIGIDMAVNAGFLRRLADLGGGCCELVESEDRLDAAMDRIHRTISSPVLTQLRLEPAGADWVHDSLAPSRLPDLFVDRPVTIYGRFSGQTTSWSVRACGVDSRGRPWQQEVGARPGDFQPLRHLWGRAKIRELEDRYASQDVAEPGVLAKQIVQLSLSAGVLSRFTAYVAVDRSEVVNAGGRPQQVIQPVELPAGWELAEAAMLAEPPAAMPCMGGVTFGRVRRFLPSAMAGRVTGGRGMGGPASKRSLPLEDLIAEAQRMLEKKVAWRARRAAWLEELADFLEALADRLRPRQRDVAMVLDQLVREARGMAADYRSGSREALKRVRIDWWREKVRKALRDVSQRPSPDPRRERFWA